MQVIVQNNVISQVLGGTRAIRPPLAIRLIAAMPFLARIPARLIGYGVRPEHVRSPAA